MISICIIERTLAAKDFGQQLISGVTRTSGNFLRLLLLTTSLLTLPIHGLAQTNNFKSENSAPPVGSIQWQINQKAFEELREQHRKRLPIFNVTGTNIPLAATAYLVNGPKIAPLPTPLPPAPPGIFFRMCVLGFLFILAGILLIRILVPSFFAELNQRFNPWSLPLATVRNSLAKNRTEEKAFGEFVSEFHQPPAGNAAALSEKSGLLAEFYARAKNRIALQKKSFQRIGRETNDSVRRKLLADLGSEVCRLKTEATFPAVLPVWQVASALEGLIKQIKNLTPSTLRTVGGALDLLGELCNPNVKLELLAQRPFKFLIVDDDLISRRALSLSLEKAFSLPDVVEDGEMALIQTLRQAYDVIFLDVQMPGIDGFDLCEKIRESDLNENTPVVFVTSQSDFDARVQSTLSGGNDLMGKPFLVFEVTVKALTLALQHRLKNEVSRPESAGELAGLNMLSKKPLRFLTGSKKTAGTPTRNSPTPAERESITTDFLAKASNTAKSLQELCKTILATSNVETRQSLLVDGYMRLNSLLANTEAEVPHPAYRISSALEGLFKKLLENSTHSTASALATIADSVELLNDTCVPELKADQALDVPIQMLVVDDDLVARRVLVGALQTAFDKPESVPDGESALALMLKKTYDVIFLDVQMPGMDGFEVCSKIRHGIQNRATPVVFVTFKSDFTARAQMVRHGGDDLVDKPFLTAEITLKALTFGLRGRLQLLDSPARKMQK